jgi:large subunit ribosomal protein L15
MSKYLSKLSPANGATAITKRRGRGVGSGLGKTSGHGHKGARSRSGYKDRAGFEGGQMPIQRRLPKRGFVNIFKHKFNEINVREIEKRAKPNDIINLSLLCKWGLCHNKLWPVKILGTGEMTKPVTIEANAVTKSALDKIQKVKGTVTIIAC